ncbi:MAG: twin transmembrane helix small protein [bacterium]
MSGFIYFLIPFALFITVAILGAGFFSLAKGGTFAKENSNKLMRFRVIAQGVTIALIVLFVILVQAGK